MNLIESGNINSDKTFELLKIYLKINKITLGKINPLIGNTISDFGYDENYSLEKKDIM